MNPAITGNQIAALTNFLCGLIARYGHLRRLGGPLVVLIWGRVRNIEAQTNGLLARLQAGQLRRYPARRPPRPAAAPRRRPRHSALPREKAWLVVLIPETAASACHLQNLLAAPEIPELLQTAPQLRRTLRPLCRMLGVTLPPSPSPPSPNPPIDPPRSHSTGAAPQPLEKSGQDPAGGKARIRRRRTGNAQSRPRPRDGCVPGTSRHLRRSLQPGSARGCACA